MTRFLLATRSEDKAREIRRILEPARIAIETLAEAGIDETPDEDGIEVFETFAGNALAKARHFAERTGRPVLADDSGIEVAALDGAPGVRSRRFSGADVRGTALDQANNRTLLERLAGVPGHARGARYVCAAVALTPGDGHVTTLGSVSGRILEAPAGDGGFGYDPLVFLPHLGRSFAQLDPVQKNRISHRARAFRALATCLA